MCECGIETYCNKELFLAAITKHFIIPPHLTLNIYTLLRSDWMRANAKVRKHNSKEG